MDIQKEKRKLILIAVVFFLAMAICFLIFAIAKPEPQEKTDYSAFFTTDRVHSVEVTLSEADWQDLCAHPLDKTKYPASVTIDGELVEEISISTKGNSSLTNVAEMENSNRYSFSLQFGKFRKGQTFHGLDRMKLSNLFHDESAMSDYLSYQIIQEAGGYAPLCTYAWLRINGKDYGLILAVEEIRQGWVGRTQAGKGVLYKPNPVWTSLSVQIPGLKFDRNHFLEYMNAAKEYYGGTDLGAGLVYTDDRIESYPGVFDEVVTETTDEDRMRLIQCMKTLNGDHPADALDADEVINYFAGHNFLLSYDNYTGIMCHNFYIHENNGKISVAAWDYNDSFASMPALLHREMTATEIVNWGIDTPLMDTELKDRPLWAWIVKDPSALDRYHTAMDQLIRNYFESGAFEKETNEIQTMIQPYIHKDPTFFYTEEEFNRAYRYVREFCEKRAESIRRQLSGTLSSVNETQKEEDRVNAEDVLIASDGVITVKE